MLATGLSTALAVTLMTAPAVATPDTGLAWGACPGMTVDPGQECATLRVPLDYRRSGGEQISVAVSRISTAKPEPRRGVLLLIPSWGGTQHARVL